MRICDLCDARHEVRPFVLLMGPADKPGAPHERDLCDDCAEFVHGQLKSIIHGRRLKVVAPEPPKANRGTKRTKKREAGQYV